MDFKDVGIRAVKTAIQVFLAGVGLGLVGVTDPATVQVAAFAAASAAVSIVMNAIIAWASTP